jgi:NADH dehydrogenase FAD-containing subunit
VLGSDPNSGRFALKKLKEMGVEFTMNTHVVGATPNSVRLDNGSIIPCRSYIKRHIMTVSGKSEKKL